MRRLKRILWLHVQVGYVLAVLVVPLLCMSLILADIIRAAGLGISPLAALQVKPRSAWLVQGALVFVTLSIVLPAALTPWVSLSRGREPLSALLRSRGGAIVVSHLVFALTSGVGLMFCYQLQEAGGYSWVGGQLDAAFPSWYLRSVAQGPLVVWLLLGGVLAVLGGTSLLFGWPHSRTLDIDRYVTRLELAALTGRLVPVHGRSAINLRSGALAPILRGVQAKWLESISRYHRCIPGSQEALTLLMSSWGRAKEMLATVGVGERAGMQLRFVGSTSRALELAIREVDSGGNVLLSPYEHPSECIVAASLGSWEQMEVGDEFFDRQWQDQMKAIVNWVVSQANESPAVLILSEVAYLTGRLIPVDELVRAIRDRDTPVRDRIRIVIDGAHAVGNVPGNRPVEVADAYVFSGHKWLLAPEPCGVILSRHSKASHDGWVQELPSASVGFAAVSGLLAALEFRDSLDRNTIDARTRELRELLVETTRERLEEVGARSGLRGTNLLTLRPRPGYRWALGGAKIEEILARKGFYVTGIERGHEPWVRIAVAFFLDWRAISDFGQSILGHVERWRSKADVNKVW